MKTDSEHQNMLNSWIELNNASTKSYELYSIEAAMRSYLSDLDRDLSTLRARMSSIRSLIKIAEDKRLSLERESILKSKQSHKPARAKKNTLNRLASALESLSKDQIETLIQALEAKNA